MTSVKSVLDQQVSQELVALTVGVGFAGLIAEAAPFASEVLMLILAFLTVAHFIFRAELGPDAHAEPLDSGDSHLAEVANFDVERAA